MRVLFMFSLFCGISVFGATTYPTYENGSNVPFGKRTLQALNVRSTFQLPREANSLNFVDGVYGEDGKRINDTREPDTYCMIDAMPSHVVPEGDAEKTWNHCVLDKIEGGPGDPIEEKMDFRTKLDLLCRGSQLVEITCRNASKGEAKEMTLDVFEKIISKHFRFANLILETPLAETKSNGFPAENPVTAQQILSKRLRFKFADTTKMDFAKEEVGDDGHHKVYVQNGSVVQELKDSGDGYLNLSIKTATGKRLPAEPNATDFNDMEITGVHSGYLKTSWGAADQIRKAWLLVRGKKEIQGVKTELVAYWSDEINSHVTYESMWKVPGRKLIENWYEIK